MELATTLAVESVKALLLLTAAVAVVLALRHRPARLRAIVLGTALVGTLLVPLLSMVVPALPVPLPVELPSAAETPVAAPAAIGDSVSAAGTGHRIGAPDPRFVTSRAPSWNPPSLESMLIGIWLLGAALVLGRHAVSLKRTLGIIRRADPVTDPAVVDLVESARFHSGCRARVRVVASPEVHVPAVFGVVRPVLLLPAHYTTWFEDRLTAVLLHELTHVARYDWPIRMLARTACAAYWFNPMGWWAARRLDLEQELACDEEVLSLGARPSTYACHLLGIARVAVHEPALAAAGLQMARRSDLEERVMRLLSRQNHRRIGLTVILPAVLLTAALVPAIASVQPAEPERKASPALQSAMAEMQEVEVRLEPHIAHLEDIEIDMAPILAEIEAIETAIDHDAIARIEEEMAPIVERMRDIEIDMAPFDAQMEAMHEHLESMTFHIDDGTLAEVREQIHAQMEAHRAQLQSIHIDMKPYHEQLERLQEELEPLHAKVAALTREQTERIHEQMELNHVVLEQQRLHMEEVHREMEPLHEEIEAMGARFEAALVDDVAAVLRSHLGSVSSPGAPFREAAARIIDEGNIHVHDDVIELNASWSEVHEILGDLFSPERLGAQDAFDRALEAATEEVHDLRILLE